MEEKRAEDGRKGWVVRQWMNCPLCHLFCSLNTLKGEFWVLILLTYGFIFTSKEPGLGSTTMSYLHR